jgi:uncharacterized alpha-E superfamily protein
VLDPLNPRSVQFQITELRAQIEMLPGGIDDGHPVHGGQGGAADRYRAAHSRRPEMTPERLDKLAADIGMLSGLVAAAYFV